MVYFIRVAVPASPEFAGERVNFTLPADAATREMAGAAGTIAPLPPGCRAMLGMFRIGRAGARDRRQVTDGDGGSDARRTAHWSHVHGEIDVWTMDIRP
ncbi:MAG TPA: hypothetical protein ENK13_03820 [Thermopetrobacter sp.]|nr:hypothetical protein [Thermopetrobacter sp.]